MAARRGQKRLHEKARSKTETQRRPRQPSHRALLCAQAAYIISLALILWYVTRNLSISQADSLCDHLSQTILDELAQRKFKTICYAYLLQAFS